MIKEINMVYVVALVNIRSLNLSIHPKQGFSSHEQAERWVYDHIVMLGWPSYEGTSKCIMWLPNEGFFGNVMVMPRSKLFK
jgi:hypothetical protein